MHVLFVSAGLCKLMEAEQSVSHLSEELVLKEQELAVASQRADGVLQEVTAKAQAAEKVQHGQLLLLLTSGSEWLNLRYFSSCLLNFLILCR